MTNTNLIYTTCGYNINWFSIILILVDSLKKYSSPINFDFLIICDDNMESFIKNYFESQDNKNKYSNLNIIIHNVGINSSKPDIASINKLRIFDYKFIDNYKKILFIDGDIISTFNISTIFDLNTDDNIMYVYKERNNINDHNNLFWGLRNYTAKDISDFKKNNIYPFNCGLFHFNNTIEIKSDFLNILNMIDTHKGEYFYEQSFMNIYFNKKGNVNYTIFTDDNYKMFPDLNQKYLNKIIHFCDFEDTNKLTKMNNYIKQHLDVIHIFDTRKEMLKFYSKQLVSPIIAEIGIFKGDFLQFLYENCDASKINAIDLFQGITQSGNEDGNFVIHYDMNKSYNELKEKYKDTIVTLHKSDSSTFLNTLNDNYYDIIYIDGDHSYNGVKKDLIASYNKIKNNGYIMGHDYEMNMKKANHHYDFGTKQAVDEFCVNYNQKILAKAYDGCVSFCIKINK